ncbi:MAG: hypothetical protein ABRQ38_08560 [Candidatus Eremiobacterota bacterium]
MDILSDISYKVENYLMKTYGGDGYDKVSDTLFVTRRGSTFVYIYIQKDKERDEAIVLCRAAVVKGARLDEPLLYNLLRMNNKNVLGRFSIDEDGYILLDHVLLGSTLDEKELITSIVHIGVIADEMDDLIIEEYGGITAVDDLLENF